MNYPLLKLQNFKQGVVIIRQEIDSFVNRIDRAHADAGSELAIDASISHCGGRSPAGNSPASAFLWPFRPPCVDAKNDRQSSVQDNTYCAEVLRNGNAKQSESRP